MKYLLASMLLLASVLTVEAEAQSPLSPGDTIQNRMLTLALLDSTLIRYEIGQIRLIQSGSSKYLGFNGSITNPCTSYLSSASFNLVGNDSVKFNRFAGFDDHRMIIDTTHYADSIRADSAGDARITAYQSRQFTPGGSYFTMSSEIRFIVQLRKLSNDSVIKNLDTVWCYLNASGHLRYRTPGRTGSWVKRKLDGVSGTSVYIKVLIEADLPSGSTYVCYGRSSDRTPPMPENKGIVPVVQDVPSFAPKIAGHFPSSTNPEITFSGIYPNPSTGSFKIGAHSASPCNATLRIISAAGQIVSEIPLVLAKGYMEKEIFTSLPSGTYTVMLFNNTDSFTQSLSIIH